ncbi:MAG: nitrophenyl compound nitroreductase subunit ArsF family protein [Acidobacteriia bacterium]|jgi:hypothetical protein|nr:nitrophenyl compound nitroreductase subunit ArsF family protein [Terriglobia bacterium]
MKAKSILRTLLLVFVVVSGVSLVIKDVRERSQSGTVSEGSTVMAATAPLQTAEGNPAPTKKPPKVIAYYFHTTFRCTTCRTIEAFSREAIEQAFGDALKNGKLEWRLVNVEERANRHFIQDYRLFTKSLILVKMKDGKQAEWKNLSRVWELVRRKDAFLRYVQDEVRAYLEAS